MISKTLFIGSWVSSLPFDSDDYLIKYDISIQNGRFRVCARDLKDGERIRITEIKYHRGVLQFLSYVPSTKRKGLNRFTIKNVGRLKSEFTFTVVEELQRYKETGKSKKEK